MADMPDLPNTGADNFLQRVRETLQTLMGNTKDTSNQAVTVQNLIDAGIAIPNTKGFYDSSNPSATSGPIQAATNGDLFQPVYVPDTGLPPQPTGLTAAAGLTTLFIQTDDPTFTVGHGYLRTIVYGEKYSGAGPLPTYTEGTTPILTEFIGSIGTYGINPNEQWHVWVKWKSVDGVLSIVAGGTNGATATSGQVQTGYVAPLAITDALIANLGVGKLNAGSIGVGAYIQSPGYVAGATGWKINGDGTAEFSGVIVRGTLYASAGTIGGATIGTNYMQSTNYLAGSAGWRFENNTGNVFVNNIGARGSIAGGAFTGYAWPAAPGTGYYLGPEGLLVGNANNGKYFQADASGNVYAPQFQIVNGVATFSGALSAASGTFAGNLSAAGGTFSGNLSAAGGTFAGALTAGAVSAVDSINIAGNAVTIPLSVNASASINMLASSEQTIMTLPTYTSKGGQVVINAGSMVSSDGTLTATWRVRRNGTQIAAFTVQTQNTGSPLLLPPVTDVPGNGASVSYTVTYQLQSNAGASAATISLRTATSMETIR